MEGTSQGLGTQLAASIHPWGFVFSGDLGISQVEGVGSVRRVIKLLPDLRPYPGPIPRPYWILGEAGFPG